MAPTSPLLAADSTITPDPAKMELPAEIWDQITRLLHRPLPRPTGRNHRSTVRQPDLAACMRVSKLLSNSAAPLLYTHIIVDSLPLLVVGLDRSAPTEGYHSKQQLLEYTKGLGLEYCHINDGSYLSLMAHGTQFSHIPTSPSDFHLVCRDETLAITTGARQLVGYLPNLETLSLAAYLDSHRAVWEDNCNSRIVGRNRLVAEAGSALTQLVGVVGLRAICQKAEWGPLTFQALLWVDPELPEPHDSIHITHIDISQSVGYIPAVINSSSQWLVRHDATTYPGDATLRLSLQKLCGGFMRIQNLRVSASLAHAKQWAPETSAFDIDVFLPSWFGDRILPRIQGMARAAMVQVLEKRSLPKAYLEPDRFAFKKDEKGKACAACGQCSEAV